MHDEFGTGGVAGCCAAQRLCVASEERGSITHRLHCYLWLNANAKVMCFASTDVIVQWLAVVVGQCHVHGCTHVRASLTSLVAAHAIAVQPSRLCSETIVVQPLTVSCYTRAVHPETHVRAWPAAVGRERLASPMLAVDVAKGLTSQSSPRKPWFHGVPAGCAAWAVQRRAR